MVVMLRNSFFVSGGAQSRTQGLKSVAYMQPALYVSLMAIDGPSITSIGMNPIINYNYGTTVS